MVDVSIVICTRNRAEFLPQFLESLSGIESDSYELVFVDSASTDATPSLLAEYKARATVPVTVVTERRPGLGRARNAGWPEAKGRIVAFTDDDCYPQPDFVEQIRLNFQAGIDYLGGRVELYDKEDLPITIKTDLDVEIYEPFKFMGPGALHGANMAFLKSLLEKMDGFDSEMGSGTPFPSEDCDAVFRAATLGAAGKYCPDVVVFHHHRRRSESDRQKIEASYLAGRGAFYMKALAYYPRKLRTIYYWLRSAKYFGWEYLPQEIRIGISYLKHQRGLQK